MKKILVADDEELICNMLEKFLTQKGYEVITALSGEEAVRKVKEEKPHIVLMDIRMSKMDGIEALKKIREIDHKAGIVMITAVKDDDIGRRCIELGAYDYITKPLDLEYLEKVLLVKLLSFC